MHVSDIAPADPTLPIIYSLFRIPEQELGGTLVLRHVYGRKPTLIYVIGLGNEGYVWGSVFRLSAPQNTGLCAFEKADCLPGTQQRARPKKPHYKIRLINFKNIVL